MNRRLEENRATAQNIANEYKDYIDYTERQREEALYPTSNSAANNYYYDTVNYCPAAW